MTIETRYNLQRGKEENKRSFTHVSTSNEDLIDKYILAKVQMRNNAGNRIILDPAAYNSLVDQAAKSITKKVVDYLKE